MNRKFQTAFIHLPACLTAVAFTAISTVTGADQGSHLKPTLRPASDRPVAQDDFSKSELSGKWVVAKGTWTVTNGNLKGVELASDKHPAVLTYRMPHTDSAVRLSFQLVGSKGFMLSYNHPKGHLFRLVVSETQAIVQTDKNKKDPASKSVVIDKKPAVFEQGKWYTVLCETRGDKVVVQFSNGVKLEGSNEALSTEKTGYRLVVKGAGVLFDDFSVLNADPK